MAQPFRGRFNPNRPQAKHAPRGLGILKYIYVCILQKRSILLMSHPGIVRPESHLKFKSAVRNHLVWRLTPVSLCASACSDQFEPEPVLGNPNLGICVLSRPGCDITTYLSGRYVMGFRFAFYLLCIILRAYTLFTSGFSRNSLFSPRNVKVLDPSDEIAVFLYNI